MQLESVFYDSAVSSNGLLRSFGDVYRYRGLVRLLVHRELTVRYKRSLLGASWTVLNPVLMSIVMWAVFNAVFHPSIPGHVPYIVYLLSGVIAVTYFQQGVTMTGASMASSAGVLTKVYVPPVVFAFAAACAGGVNFLLGLTPLVLLETVLGPRPSWTFLLLPIPLVLLMATVTGIGLVVASLQIQFNDILELTNVLMLLIGYLTPTFYPITIIPVHYRKFFYINPMYSFVNIFRFVEYHAPWPGYKSFVAALAFALLFLVGGMAVFVKRWPRLAVLL